MTAPLSPPSFASTSRTTSPASALRTGLTLIFVALAAAAGLFLAWQTAGTLLLIFAGLLLASVLDACTRGLAYVLPIRRGWRLAVVCLTIALGTAWLLVWGGYNLFEQADNLVQLIGDQLRNSGASSGPWGSHHRRTRKRRAPWHSFSCPIQAHFSAMRSRPSTSPRGSSAISY